MKLISTGFKVYSPPFPFHLQLLPKDKKEESDAAVVQVSFMFTPSSCLRTFISTASGSRELSCEHQPEVTSGHLRFPLPLS